MKRFLVFAFEEYYPAGGWYDFQRDFDTKEDAMAFVEAHRNDFENWQLVDTAKRGTDQEHEYV